MPCRLFIQTCIEYGFLEIDDTKSDWLSQKNLNIGKAFVNASGYFDSADNLSFDQKFSFDAARDYWKHMRNRRLNFVVSERAATRGFKKPQWNYIANGSLPYWHIFAPWFLYCYLRRRDNQGYSNQKYHPLLENSITLNFNKTMENTAANALNYFNWLLCSDLNSEKVNTGDKMAKHKDIKEVLKYNLGRNDQSKFLPSESDTAVKAKKEREVKKVFPL